MKNGPAVLATVVATTIAALVGIACSAQAATFHGIPVFLLCVAIAFLVQWIAFVPAFSLQTERFFDLTGSLTYIGLVVVALLMSGARDARSLIIATLVVVWAVRLGSFLALRIHRDGFDRRFNSIKPNFAVFLMTWTLQGLWVSLTLACGLAAITSVVAVPVGWFAALGVVLWSVGFGIEVVADSQKKKFRADPNNRDQFITTGLWAWSRHPNYFGEILLWVGIAVVAFPALSGWQYVSLVSPLFVFVLLTRISGVRMLEARGDRKWGGDPAYRQYRAQTPALLLRPPVRLPLA